MDIRTPIGAMFIALGLLLGLFGGFTAGREGFYERSLGINMNLWWGLVMLAFGVLMLLWGRRAARTTFRGGSQELPPPQRGS